MEASARLDQNLHKRFYQGGEIRVPMGPSEGKSFGGKRRGFKQKDPIR